MTSREQRTITIAALYVKRSSAYDLAISEILNFYKDIPVGIEIHAYFTDYDVDRIREVLDISKLNGIDLVFTMGSDTTNYVWEVHTDYPMAFISVSSKDPITMGYLENLNSTSNTNFAFTSLNMPEDIQFLYLREFIPNLLNFVIMVDVNNLSSMQTQAIPLQMAAEALGINVIMVEVDAFEHQREEINQQFRAELEEAMVELSHVGATINNTLFWMTGSTILFERYELLNSIVGNFLVGTTIPDQTIGPMEHTPAFGIGVTFKSNARIAVGYSYEILFNNVDPGSLPIGMVIPPDISIHLEHFQRKGISIPFSLLEIANLIR